MTKEQIITNNSAEHITIKWDGERFALIAERRARSGERVRPGVVILNPSEMKAICRFAREVKVKPDADSD